MVSRKIITCRFCQGDRETTADGKRCSGCGSFKANAVRKRKTKRNVPHCPRCGSTSRHELENGEGVCLNCRTQYGADDVGYIHAHPVRNAMKKGL